MTFESTLNYAQEMDAQDKLASFRSSFFIPQHQGKDCIYLTGNSLGLQPKSAEKYLKEELEAWQQYGVDGHFEGKRPWFHYHKFFSESVSRIVGAHPHEVVVMNNLTVNLHLMMVSFYRPEGNRYKIVMEAGAFPSDQYAMESQVKFHGYEYDDAVIEVKPRDNLIFFAVDVFGEFQSCKTTTNNNDSH
jgi:kynureninase